MDLSIIVVNYNTKKITADCLDTIRQSTDKLNKEVIVVDNASTDGSVAYLNQKFPRYKIISSAKNLGFAGGNNLGVKQATGNYVWLLNSDTLLEKNTISTLMKAVKTNNSLIASCRILNSNGSIQPQGGYLPDLWRLKAWMLFIDDLPLIKNLMRPYHQNLTSWFKQDQRPGWLSGTALLIKRDFYNQMKGLDQNIFMYGEDVEFCLRAAQKGIKIDYFAKPQLIHLGQASGSSSGAILGEYQGLKYIYQKHKSAWQFCCLRLLLKFGALLRVIILRRGLYAEAFRLA
ncbi:MAG: glycosyltransferase family 2 protein [Candidatus Beckwithbacteria bacterium]|nr:glycosyltransferase family 2 protein [Candidatus Beckwithbacteria bacterium]